MTVDFEDMEFALPPPAQDDEEDTKEQKKDGKELVQEPAADGDGSLDADAADELRDLLLEKDDEGVTGLHTAALAGDAQVVNDLVETAAKLNIASDTLLETTDDRGWTPLHMATAKGHGDVVIALLKAGAAVETGGDDDNLPPSPLHLASLNGHGTIMQVLIEHGAKVNEGDAKTGMTPGHYACIHGHVEPLAVLALNSADWTTTDKQLRTVMHEACARGMWGCVEVLLELTGDSLLSTEDCDGRTPLQLCVMKNQPQCVQQITSRFPSEKDRVDGGGNNLLHLAASTEGVQNSIVWDLLDIGTSYCQRNSSAVTPLEIAASIGNVHFLAFVRERCASNATDEALEEGGDETAGETADGGTSGAVSELFNKKTNEGHTLLHIAAAKGYIAMMSFLIRQCHCDINGKHEETGATPLHYCASTQHNDALSWLVDNGADVHAVTNKGQTPMHQAAVAGRKLNLVTLGVAGATLECEDDSGRTILHCACSGKGGTEDLSPRTPANRGVAGVEGGEQDGGMETVCLILGLTGSSMISHPDKDGCTPIHCCAMHGRCEPLFVMAKELQSSSNPGEGDRVSLKTALNQTDGMGWTPLHMAAANGHVEVVQYLLELGADPELETTSGVTAYELADQAKHQDCVQSIAVRLTLNKREEDAPGK